MGEIISLAFIVWSLQFLYSDGWTILIPIVGFPLAMSYFVLSLMERFFIEGDQFRIDPGTPTEVTRWDSIGKDAASLPAAQATQTQSNADDESDLLPPPASYQPPPQKSEPPRESKKPSPPPPPEYELPNFDEMEGVDLGELDDFFKKKP